jgi:autotransporter-associated beta strand protein
MKTSKPHSAVFRNTVKLSLLSGALLLSANGQAADWTAGTGLFNDANNWDPVGVPTGVDASVTNGGTTQVVNGNSLAVNILYIGGNSGVGAYTQSGGDFAATQLIVGGDNNNGGTGVGTFTMSGGNFFGGSSEHWIGSRGGTGTLNMSGGMLTADNWFIIGRDGGSTGTANLSGTAQIVKNGGGNIAIGVATGSTTNTVTMTGQSQMTSNNDIRVGWLNNGTQGVLNMSDDTAITASNVAIGMDGATGVTTLTGNAIVNATNELWVGQNASGSGTLTAGGNSTINVTNGFVVGRFNSTGSFTANNTATVNVGGFFVVGDGDSSTANVEVNGSTTITAGQQLWVGLNASTSTMTMNGGTFTAHAPNDPGVDPSGAGVGFRGTSGTLILNGGKLITPGFSQTSGTAQLTLNGAIVEASASIAEFFSGMADGTVLIGNGGAKIDSAGNIVTTAVGLTGTGSFTKLGEGLVALLGNNTYTGNTIIEKGTLSFSFASINDASSVFISADGFLNLDTGGLTDTINGLFINGVAQQAGVWGAIGSGAQFTSSQITGSGFLNVTNAIPEPSTVLLSLGGLGALLIFRRKTAR